MNRPAPCRRPLCSFALIGCTVLLHACSSGTGGSLEAQATSALSPANSPSATPSTPPAATADRRTGGTAVAMVGQARLSSDELLRPLLEASGAAVLEEAALDRLLERELVNAGISITATDTRAEEDQLLQAASEQARVSRDQAARALADLRRARGLGPARFAALLTRNAKLRSLVRATALPNEQDLAIVREAEVGERVRARLVVLPDALSAGQTRARVLERAQTVQSALGSGAESVLSALVAQAAIEQSIHATASRGGLLDPLSPADPSVPATVREALATTAPGQLSAILPLEQGFGVILVESKQPGHAPSTDESARIERQATARAQRRAMDTLARELLLRGGVTPLDESLRWSWESRTR
jgi:parvulin-like peptidyl-prolyl isomerase